jgi:hypothetical protein
MYAMAIGGMEIVYFSPLQLTRGSVGHSHGCADVQGSIVTRGCPSLLYVLLLWVLHSSPLRCTSGVFSLVLMGYKGKPTKPHSWGKPVKNLCLTILRLVGVPLRWGD